MLHAVVDASVIVSWLLPEETNGKHEGMLNNIDKMKIHVPSIFEYEFMNILANAEKNKRIDNATAMGIIEIVSQYPIAIESSTAVLKENINIFKIARAHDLTTYDAAYLELALRLGVPLITYDKLLLNTAKKLKLKTSFDAPR